MKYGRILIKILRSCLIQNIRLYKQKRTALGVSKSIINKDLQPVQKWTNVTAGVLENKEKEANPVQKWTPPSTLTKSPDEIIRKSEVTDLVKPVNEETSQCEMLPAPSKQPIFKGQIIPPTFKTQSTGNPQQYLYFLHIEKGVKKPLNDREGHPGARNERKTANPDRPGHVRAGALQHEE